MNDGSVELPGNETDCDVVTFKSVKLSVIVSLGLVSGFIVDSC